jgi:predicted metal-dependent peptidase
MDEKARERLSKARSNLILNHPFFGSLALRQPLIEDSSVKTMITNGRRIRYNPEWVKEKSEAELIGVVAHEVFHPALLHHVRRQGRDKKTWNAAGDHVINLILREHGFTLPEGAYADPAFVNLSTEEVYKAIYIDSVDDGQGEGSGKGTGGGESDDGEDGQSDIDDNDPGGCGGVEDCDDELTPAEQAEAERQMREQLAQAMNLAKACGKELGSIAQLMGAVVKGDKVNWKELLRQFMSKAAKVDYDWNHPNRRHVCRDLYLPSLHSDRMPPVVIALDTSGSISQAEMSAFVAEARAIIEDLRPESVTMLMCDTRVRWSEEYTDPNDMPTELTMRGGGGTSFDPVFDFVDTMDRPPSCVIYMTDLLGRCNRVDSDYPVLWLAPQASAGYEHWFPKFGERVFYEEGGLR